MKLIIPLALAALILGLPSPAARAAAPSLAYATSRVHVTNVVQTKPQSDNTIADRHLRSSRWRWRAFSSRTRRTFSAMRDMETAPPIRVICVPPAPATASAQQWIRAERLAVALAACRELDAPSVPEDQIVVDVHTPLGGWTVVLLPRALEETRDKRLWARGLAVAIENRLNEEQASSPDALDAAITRLERQRSIAQALNARPALRPRTVWDG